MMVMVRAMEKITEANGRNCSSSHWRTALFMTVKGRDKKRRLSKIFFVEELAAMGSGFGEDCKSISEDTNFIDHHKAQRLDRKPIRITWNVTCPRRSESNNDGHIESVSQ